MKGDKCWLNTWTEAEDLGSGKFGATISVGHRVFFDKADGNKPKKHKLTDNRPDHVVIQSAQCCIEVYPYYAKYFDVQHEEVRLHEERWEIQRWRDPPGKWWDVDIYNPVISIEEYSEPAGDIVKVTVSYDTDYGVLTVEYFQRDGNNLKHNVTFKNTSGSTETFRVVQAWAGIVGTKCNGKNAPVVEDAPYFAFHNSENPQKKFNMAENLYSMIFNDDGSEKLDQCLQRPITIESHAQGMKADLIYSQWVLANGESLVIDPATATLSDPAEDGHISDGGARNNTHAQMSIGNWAAFRAYVEWDVSSLVGATITDTVFKYNGHANAVDCHIHEMVGTRPIGSADADVYTEAGEGTVYADVAGFPVVGTGKEIDLGASADTDLGNQLGAGWFAIGIQVDVNEGNSVNTSFINSENKTDAADPKPTLYVEYTPAGWSGKISGVTNPAKVMGVAKANIAKVKGVA